MRRSILRYPSLLFAVVSVSALLVAGSAAGRSMIVCPQNAQSAPQIVPCCPVPVDAVHAAADVQPICCQLSACCANTPCCATTCCTSTCCAAGACPSSLTIASTPNPSRAGNKVVISGRMLSNSSSGTTVALWQELPGQTSFHQIAQSALSSSAQYTFTLGRGQVNSDRKWYVTASGLHSPTMEQLVGAVISLASSSRTVTAGTPVALRGHVTPSHAGETVLIEQRAGGRWVVIARPRLSRGSSYFVSHRFTHAGRTQLRAVLRADSRNNTSDSRTVTVAVKP
jgi:hypothetical protein